MLRGGAGGTLRQSLRSALERVVTEAATVVLVELDTCASRLDRITTIITWT